MCLVALEGLLNLAVPAQSLRHYATEFDRRDGSSFTSTRTGGDSDSAPLVTQSPLFAQRMTLVLQ